MGDEKKSYSDKEKANIDKDITRERLETTKSSIGGSELNSKTTYPRKPKEYICPYCGTITAGFIRWELVNNKNEPFCANCDNPNPVEPKSIE